MPDAPDGQEGPAEWAMHRVAQSQVNSGQQAAPPSLEGLPAELRLRILSDMPDLKTLRSLIHASPVYFAQYRIDPKPLLSRCLEADLGREVLTEAIAAFNSKSSKIGTRARPNSNVTDFLDLYGWWRYNRSPTAMLESMSLADIRWITWNHTSTVRPLSARLSTWALANLKSAVAKFIPEKSAEEGRAPVSSACPDGVSRTERTRIQRALYRFQIFCNLFSGKQDQTWGFVSDDIDRFFFCPFDSWEVEEIHCVFQWIKQRYDQVVAEVKWDFSPGNPKYEDEVDNEFEHPGYLTLDRDPCEYLHGTIGRGGLRFALHMTQVTDHAKLLELVPNYFTQALLPCFFEDCMERNIQVQRRWLAPAGPSDKDLAEQRRESMPFAGDEDPSASPTQAVTADTALNETESGTKGGANVITTCGSPLAWVLMWDGKYCNLYGDYVPDEFRQWGYVLWDESRWKAVHGATQLLLETWKSSSQYHMAKADFDWLRDLP